SDKLYLNPHPAQDRQDAIQLAESHQGFSTNNRHVYRAMAADKRQHAINQSLPLIVAYCSKRAKIPQMLWFIGVTTRAAKGTFAGDFDRQHRIISAQNPAPCS